MRVGLWPGGQRVHWPRTGDSAGTAEWSEKKIIANQDPTISSALNSRLKFPALDYAFVIFTLLEKLLFDFLKKKISFLFPYPVSAGSHRIVFVSEYLGVRGLGGNFSHFYIHYCALIFLIFMLWGFPQKQYTPACGFIFPLYTERRIGKSFTEDGVLWLKFI